MTDTEKINKLVNLQQGFFRCERLAPCFDRLASLGEVRKTSHTVLRDFRQDLAWADVWIGWGWPEATAELLANASRLKFAGHINCSREGALALLERGIVVSEARHCWSPAVAEMALALILSGLRKLSDYHSATRAGVEHWPPFENFPTNIDPLERELTGRSVGLVGFGGIGRRLAELLQPFRTDLRVHDPFVPPDVAAEYGAKLVALMEVVSESDVVVLCAANTDEAKRIMRDSRNT